MSSSLARLSVLAFSACALAPAAHAQSSATGKPPVVLTEAEKQEKAARKDCKVRICDAFRNKRAAGGDISCAILKTWRAEDLQEVMAKGKLSWPWGAARCTSDIRLPRQMLVAAVSEPRYEAEIGTHKVSCEVDRAKQGDRYTLSFEIKPKVTFENGKATKAKLSWGKVEGSSAAKGALWTATSVDNTFNVLQGSVVEQINAFLGPKCDEVKDEIAAK